LKREKIAKRKLDAEEAGDAEEIMRCDAELAALENSAMSAVNGHSNNAVKASPVKKAAAPNQQDQLAKLNMKNRAQTVQEVRKALLGDRRKHLLAREQEAKSRADDARKAEEAAKLLAVPGDMKELFGDSDASRAGTPVPGGTPRRSRAGTPSNGPKKEKSGVKAVLGAIGKKRMDDEVIGGLDLGIDVEI